MVPAAPFPLPPELPLTAVLTCAARVPAAPSDPPLGAWLRRSSYLAAPRGSGRSVFLRAHWHGHPLGLILGPDLGSLLRRCAWIVVRVRESGREPVMAVRAEDLILTRALRVVTALPYLPTIDTLRALFPDLCGGPAGIEVPLACRSPEEVLAACAAARVPVVASRVVYQPARRNPPVLLVAERPTPSG